MLRHVAILALFAITATTAHADFWPTFPQPPTNLMRKAQLIGGYFHAAVNKSERFGDGAISEQFTNDPKNAIAVDPRDATCVPTAARDHVAYSIDLTQNGQRLYTQNPARGDMTSNQLLNCGQALLRAGNRPTKIPLNQILNNVTGKADLKQSIDVAANRVKIVPDEFDSAYYTLVVDDRYHALKLSAAAAAKAHEQLDLARRDGMTVTVNFKHSLFDPGLTLSKPALTASADPAITGSVDATGSAR